MYILRIVCAIEAVRLQNTTSKESRYVGSMLLERRSLILVTDQAYSYYLHEIDERLTDEITDKVFNRRITRREIGEKIDRELRLVDLNGGQIYRRVDLQSW